MCFDIARTLAQRDRFCCRLSVLSKVPVRLFPLRRIHLGKYVDHTVVSEHGSHQCENVFDSVRNSLELLVPTVFELLLKVWDLCEC